REPGRDEAPRQATPLTVLQRLRANESAPWHTVVHWYTPLVYHWCGRRGVRGADADDVVQEVFQAASTHFDKFRHDRPGDTFRGWLHGITRNMILLHFRRSGRQPQASGGTDAFLKLQEVADTAAEAPEGEDPSEQLDALHRRALELVRDRFEERTWRAFWLTAIEGRSPVDIAAVLGTTPAAVRMAKSRVLHRLKEEFADLIQ